MSRAALKVLFVSRAYPPVLGGIEKQNYEIAQALAAVADVEIIANRRGKAFLPLFLCYALVRVLLRVRSCDVVLLGDGVLALLGFIVKRLGNTPVVCILHGLDITVANPFYQHWWLQRFLPALDRYIAVGNETIRQGILRGLPEDRFVFIENGVAFSAPPQSASRAALERIVGHSLPGSVVLTLGRLVKRKGVEWFVREVMPGLPAHISYIIAGDGRERQSIRQAISDLGLERRVIVLGAVSEEDKQILLHGADLFVQPNIPVAGDMEGFGLVVLEAAAAGCVVAASRLEGLQDAIHDGHNGILLTAQDAPAWITTITRLLEDAPALALRGQTASAYVRQHFSWQAIAGRYLQQLQQVAGKPENTPGG